MQFSSQLINDRLCASSVMYATYSRRNAENGFKGRGERGPLKSQIPRKGGHAMMFLAPVTGSRLTPHAFRYSLFRDLHGADLSEMQPYANDHKAKISQFVADNPGAPREEIRKKLPGSYDYIIKTDPDWFWNLIPRAKGQRRAPSTRRGAGDSAIAASFQAAADGLRSMSRPVRITSYGICKAAGVTHNVMGRLNEFPITAAVLSKYSETMEAFRDRKLCWAIAKMASSKVPISVNLLRRWAGMPAKHVYDRVDLIQKAANESGAEVQHRSLFAKQDRGELPAPSST
jgi:hypothetical protein